MYVVITRQGYGEMYSFRAFALADEHPLYQYGDAIVHDGRSVARQFNRLEMPGLLTRLGHPLVARQMESEFAKLNATERERKLQDYGELAWQYIKKAAVEPPKDPAEICKIIAQDRRKTKQREFIMAKKATKVEEKVEDQTFAGGEAGVEAAAEKPAKAGKKAKEPKEPSTSGRTRVSEDFVISLLSDKEGNKYGPENNPKRVGSSSHGRFASYRDGMTVKEAIEAGLKRDDITWDVNKGYIQLSAA